MLAKVSRRGKHKSKCNEFLTNFPHRTWKTFCDTEWSFHPSTPGRQPSAARQCVVWNVQKWFASLLTRFPSLHFVRPFVESIITYVFRPTFNNRHTLTRAHVRSPTRITGTLFGIQLSQRHVTNCHDRCFVLGTHKASYRHSCAPAGSFPVDEVLQSLPQKAEPHKLCTKQRRHPRCALRSHHPSMRLAHRTATDSKVTSTHSLANRGWGRSEKEAWRWKDAHILRFTIGAVQSRTCNWN